MLQLLWILLLELNFYFLSHRHPKLIESQIDSLRPAVVHFWLLIVQNCGHQTFAPLSVPRLYILRELAENIRIQRTTVDVLCNLRLRDMFAVGRQIHLLRP